MHLTSLLPTLLLLTTTLAIPFPFNNLPSRTLSARGDQPTDLSTVFGTTCIDPSVNIVEHDKNVAILSICGGIAGAIQKCGGNPTTTVGESGTAKFTLTALGADSGATINVSKGRWERCVIAARSICPTGTLSSNCVGGTSDGSGFSFALEGN